MTRYTVEVVDYEGDNPQLEGAKFIYVTSSAGADDALRYVERYYPDAQQYDVTLFTRRAVAMYF